MNNTPNPPKEEPTKEVEKAAAVAETAKQATSSPLEATVRAYFKNDPILAEIAYCESKFEQFDENGDSLKGVVTPEDIGIMQINEYYHGTAAQKMGFDLHTVEGNLGYAQWLYQKEGARPWMASSKCWNARINKDLALK